MGTTFTAVCDTTFSTTTSRGTNGTPNTFSTGGSVNGSNSWTDVVGNLFAVPSANKLRCYSILSGGTQFYQDGTTSGNERQLENVCYRDNAAEAFENGEILLWLPPTALTLNQNSASGVIRYTTDKTGIQGNITCNPSAGNYKWQIYNAYGATPTRSSPKNNGSNWMNVSNAFTSSENTALTAIFTAGRKPVFGLATVTAKSNDRTYIVLRIYDGGDWATYDSSGGNRPFPVCERIITSLDADTSPSGTLRRSGSPGVAKYNFWGGSGGSNNADTLGLDGFRAYSLTETTTCGDPFASVPAGSYATTQTVRLQSDALGATIRYTLDGSTPSTTVGTVYNADSPIIITSTTTVKAIAYRSGDSGMSNSSVVTLVYTITSPPGFTITTPESYRVFPMQPHGNGAMKVSARCFVDASYGAGNIQYSLDGSTWANVSNLKDGSGNSISTLTGDASTGTPFTATIPNVAAGQYTLTLRHSANPSQTATQPYVGVGFNILFVGQSNMVGYVQTYNMWYTQYQTAGGTTNVYTGSLKAGLLSNDGTYREAPSATQSSVAFDSPSGQSFFDPPALAGFFDTSALGAAIVPAFIGQLMSLRAVPVQGVPGAAGGTPALQWQPPTMNVADYPSDITLTGPGQAWEYTGANRSSLFGASVYRGWYAGGVNAVVWWQGESDILGTDMTDPTGYNTIRQRELNILSMYAKIFNCPVFVIKLQQCGSSKEFTPLANGSYPANTTAFNKIIDSIGGANGVLVPVDLSGVSVAGNSDQVHIQAAQVAGVVSAFNAALSSYHTLWPALDNTPANAPKLTKIEISSDGATGNMWFSEPVSGTGSGLVVTRQNGQMVNVDRSSPSGVTNPCWRNVTFNPPLYSGETFQYAMTGSDIANVGGPTALANFTTAYGTATRAVNRSAVAQPTITGITITPGSGNVASGTAMSATVNGTNVGPYQSVSWSTVGGSIDSVTGVLTGTNGTSALVTATSLYDGTSASVNVTITVSGSAVVRPRRARNLSGIPSGSII